MVSDEPVGEARVWERWSPSSSSKLGWSTRRRRRRRRDIRALPAGRLAGRGGSGGGRSTGDGAGGRRAWGGAWRRADLGALMKIRGAGKGSDRTIGEEEEEGGGRAYRAGRWRRRSLEVGVGGVEAMCLVAARTSWERERERCREFRIVHFVTEILIFFFLLPLFHNSCISKGVFDLPSKLDGI